MKSRETVKGMKINHNIVYYDKALKIGKMSAASLSMNRSQSNFNNSVINTQENLNLRSGSQQLNARVINYKEAMNTLRDRTGTRNDAKLIYGDGDIQLNMLNQRNTIPLITDCKLKSVNHTEENVSIGNTIIASSGP